MAQPKNPQCNMNWCEMENCCRYPDTCGQAAYVKREVAAPAPKYDRVELSRALGLGVRTQAQADAVTRLIDGLCPVPTPFEQEVYVLHRKLSAAVRELPK